MRTESRGNIFIKLACALKTLTSHTPERDASDKDDGYQWILIIFMGTLQSGL